MGVPRLPAVASASGAGDTGIVPRDRHGGVVRE
jgi:hypothetical protein